MCNTEIAYSHAKKDRKNLIAVAYMNGPSNITILTNHFEELIEKNGWSFYRIYADSRTDETNDGLIQMMADAEAGLFDVIVTKSVSRLMTNKVNILDIACKLLLLPSPVEIIFEDEQLSTFHSSTYMMLSMILFLSRQENMTEQEQS